MHLSNVFLNFPKFRVFILELNPAQPEPAPEVREGAERGHREVLLVDPGAGTKTRTQTGQVCN